MLLCVSVIPESSVMTLFVSPVGVTPSVAASKRVRSSRTSYGPYRSVGMQSNQFAWVYLTFFSLFFFDLGLDFVWRSEPVSKNASRYACGFSVLLRTSEKISSVELTE